MAITGDDNGYYSTVTGQYYASQEAASAAEGAITNPLGAAPPAKRQPTPEEQQSAVEQAGLNDQVARWDAATGTFTYVPMSPQEAAANRIKRASSPAGEAAAPADPNGNPADIVAQTRAQLGLGQPGAAPAQTTAQRLATGGTSPGQSTTDAIVAAPRPTRMTGTSANPVVAGAFTAPPKADAPGAPTGQPAPKVDTSASDKSVAGVNNTINQLVQLANTDPGTSAAEAQLAKSDALAKLRAADELRNSQSATLGAARSSRNRGDAGVLERAAVGESSYLGTKAQNQDVMRQAELEGNQAILRATEEDNDRKTRGELLAKAADLGMNVAALQVDISKADLGSVNNYINEQFAQLGIDKQVSAQEMGQILSFSQAMSAIKYDYDKMSNDDQQHTLDLMMQQYGIDANTQVAMKQIQANHKGTLEKVFDGVLGLVGAAAPVVAAGVTSGGKK